LRTVAVLAAEPFAPAGLGVGRLAEVALRAALAALLVVAGPLLVAGFEAALGAWPRPAAGVAGLRLGADRADLVTAAVRDLVALAAGLTRPLDLVPALREDALLVALELAIVLALGAALAGGRLAAAVLADLVVEGDRWSVRRGIVLARAVSGARQRAVLEARSIRVRRVSSPAVAP